MDSDIEAKKPMNGGGDRSDDETTCNIGMSESKTPLKTPTKEIEVKFISASDNGEPKIQVKTGKDGFTGMSKEELLKYINDPFWVRLRTALFILFWLTWVAMFAAAIAIVVMAPKCEPPKPKNWFEKGPIVKVDLAKDGKSLANLANSVKSLNTLSIKSIILPDLTVQVDGGTTDFKTIDRTFGGLEDLKLLIKEAKEKAIRIIVSLIPNYTSRQHEWFKKSVAKEEPFTSYYVWKSTPSPDKLPNNWFSPNDTPAWTFDSDRKEFYLHQLGVNQPDLNFRNAKLKEEFDGILNYWISLGVSGFNLDKVQYILEDESLSDEERGMAAGGLHTEYKFWRHTKTFNVPDLADLLASWRTLVRKDDQDRVIFITGEPPIAANMNKTVADLFRSSYLLDDQEAPLTPYVLNEKLGNVLNRRGYTEWPVIELLPPGRYISQVAPIDIDALNLITMLLPGTPIVQLGDERGLTADNAAKLLSNNGTASDDADNVHLEMFEEASKLRETEAVLHGALNIAVVNNGSALAVTRWKAGYPGYIAVWNSSPYNQTMDLSTAAHLPEELITVISGRESGGLARDVRVMTNAVTLPPHSPALFTFVLADG